MNTTARLEGIVVLIVEDNEDSRTAVSRILEKEGARVLSAANGSLALAILSGTMPDVLVSDIAMPEMDGLDLIEAIRTGEKSQRPAHYLPAVAVTAFTTEVDRRKCLQAGFQSHISKPIDSDALIATVACLANSSDGAPRRETGSTKY